MSTSTIVQQLITCYLFKLSVSLELVTGVCDLVYIFMSFIWNIASVMWLCCDVLYTLKHAIESKGS